MQGVTRRSARLASENHVNSIFFTQFFFSSPDQVFLPARRPPERPLGHFRGFGSPWLYFFQKSLISCPPLCRSPCGLSVSTQRSWRSNRIRTRPIKRIHNSRTFGKHEFLWTTASREAEPRHTNRPDTDPLRARILLATTISAPDHN